MFETKYRISRDWCYTFMWAVERKTWLWPFWVEYRGMLNSMQDAKSLIELLERQR